MDRSQAEKILKEKFGIDHFFNDQWTTVEKLLSNKRVLLIEATGFGKSLCYQFVASQLPGLTIVFSPLIALMRDQVRVLKKYNISTDYINSNKTYEENQKTIERAKQGAIKILYIAPERQENQEWIQTIPFLNISMVVIDEAHTISVWGHDFRPSFRRLINLIRVLPNNIPILATTATANLQVQADIEDILKIQLTTLRGPLKRDNLSLYVHKVNNEEEKFIFLAKILPKLSGTGIIYTGTKVDTETYYNFLKFLNYDVLQYHSRLSASQREQIEKRLINNQCKCVVATNALGMGIDKPDIRFIIHTQMPSSPIHYYQEIGRAGRDHKPATIILLYNGSPDITKRDRPHDLTLPFSFIEKARPPKEKYLSVIEAIKLAPRKEFELIAISNLNTNQIRTINADLIDQKIIRKVRQANSSVYEYMYNAPPLDYRLFDDLKKVKLKNLQKMLDYINTTEPRMQFLCNYLDSYEKISNPNCDNTTLKKTIRDL